MEEQLTIAYDKGVKTGMSIFTEFNWKQKVTSLINGLEDTDDSIIFSDQCQSKGKKEKERASCLVTV